MMMTAIIHVSYIVGAWVCDMCKKVANYLWEKC